MYYTLAPVTTVRVVVVLLRSTISSSKVYRIHTVQHFFIMLARFHCSGCE